MKAWLAAILVPLSAGASTPETIRPGYWEARETVEAPIHTLKTENRCLAQKDVTRFMSCYINHHYDCQCPEQSYANGEIHYRGICVDKKGRTVSIHGEGRYTPTTLHLEAEIGFKLGGLPLTARAETDARRIGDECPSDAPPKSSASRP